MVNRITNMRMPFMEWGLSKQSYAKGQETWLEGRFLFPGSLWTPRSKSDMWTECTVAINNALLPTKATEKNKELLGEARAHMEHRFAGHQLDSRAGRQRAVRIVEFRQYADLDGP